MSTGFVLNDFLSKPLQKSVLLECLQNAGVLPDSGPVLIVDDDVWSTKLMEVALRELGYRPLSKSSGEEALRAVRQDPPAVIVLDLLMPQMNGFEFLDELRSTPLGRSIPVIVWTVKDLTPEERRRLSLLAQSVVLKTSGGNTAALLEKLDPYLASAERLPPADED
jgi:CheY-like chemotaxis protein